MTILLNEFSPFPLLVEVNKEQEEISDNSLKRVLSISTGAKAGLSFDENVTILLNEFSPFPRGYEKMSMVDKRKGDNSLKRVLSISTYGGEDIEEVNVYVTILLNEFSPFPQFFSKPVENRNFEA